MWFPDPPSIDRLNAGIAPQDPEEFERDWGTYANYLSDMAKVFYQSRVPDRSARLLEVFAGQLDKALDEKPDDSLLHASIEFEIFEEQIARCEYEWSSQADEFFAADLEFAERHQAADELVTYFRALILEGVRRLRTEAGRLYQDKVGHLPPNSKRI